MCRTPARRRFQHKAVMFFLARIFAMTDFSCRFRLGVGAGLTAQLGVGAGLTAQSLKLERGQAPAYADG